MSPSFKSSDSEETQSSRPMLVETVKARRVIAWSSLFFVLLQSVCTFFVALDGLRVLIGVGALASVTEAGVVWDRVHTDWIRLPMVGFALIGALLNLTILLRIRRLRARPSSQWRQQPLTARQIRMERVQFVLAVVTLILLAVEELTHFHTLHRF